MRRGESGARGGVRQSVYLPNDIIEDLEREAKRQDRAMSWLMQQAWKMARGTIQKFPGADDLPPRDDG